MGITQGQNTNDKIISCNYKRFIKSYLNAYSMQANDTIYKLVSAESTLFIQMFITSPFTRKESFSNCIKPKVAMRSTQ